MTALATPTQLGALLQEPLSPTDASALLLLDIASSMVRDYLQAQIDFIPGDVPVIDPVDGTYAILPEIPVSAVSQLETFDGTTWNVIPPANYTVSVHMGIVSALTTVTSIAWPSASGTWRVTYDHGFAVVPMSIIGVVLGVAARAYARPFGIDSERIGGYQVKYSMESDGFTPLEVKALRRYPNPRVA